MVGNFDVINYQVSVYEQREHPVVRAGRREHVAPMPYDSLRSTILNSDTNYVSFANRVVAVVAVQ